MAKRVGNRTVIFENDIYIGSFASAVGPKEKEGPLGGLFDREFDDEFLGEKSFEKAESRLQKIAVTVALEKAGVKKEDIDVIYAGDLLNQCIGSAYGLRELEIPFIGLYGACSTMSLGLINAAISIESGAAERTVAVTSSHFCSSERQFRFPLEYGGQRPPTSQWTVTGAGAVMLNKTLKGPKIKAATIGKIVDKNVTDMNNMGAAMAPAAADTLIRYFDDTKTCPEDYDLIYTGDLGYIGTQCLYELMDREGVDIKCRHNDCGLMIYDRKAQDVHSGGSGCGCSASVLCSYVMHRMEEGQLNNIIFMSTGALMSPTSSFQGESIPGIAHLLNIKNDNEQ